MTPQRHLLITGGPGSGKTTEAVKRAAFYAETIQEHQNILFLSFSNSAVRQIREVAQIRFAQEVEKRIVISTYHGFCHSVLRGYGELVGLSRNWKILNPADEPGVIFRSKADSKVPHKVILESHAKEAGSVSFSLFASFLVKALNRSPSVLQLIAKKYPFLVVDEFQDTDQDEWDLVKLIGRHVPVLCLADSQQRIYDFRPGVSATRVDDMKAVFSPEHIDFGNQNHRSKTNNLLGFANSLLGDTGGPAPNCVGYVSYGGIKQLGATVKRTIVAVRAGLVKAGVNRPKIVILAARNDMVRRLSAALLSTSGKYKFPVKHQAYFEEDLITFTLRLIVVLLEARTHSAQTLAVLFMEIVVRLKYCDPTKTGLQEAERLEKWCADLKAGNKIPKNSFASKLIKLVETLKLELSGDTSQDLKNIKIGMIALKCTALKDVAEVLSLGIRQLFQPDCIHALSELQTTPGTYRETIAALDQHIIRKAMADSSGTFSPNVCVMTAHKSKGREFDAVILVDHPKVSPFFSGKNEDLEKTKLLARVAVTRARHRFVLIHQRGSVPRPF